MRPASGRLADAAKRVSRSSKGGIKVRFLPDGVTSQVTTKIGRTIESAFGEKGKTVVVRSLNFLPSTQTQVESGVQIIASTTLQEALEGAPQRVVESVVTLGNAGDKVVLKDVRVPALER